MFAGHGFNRLGRQCLGTNKFDFSLNFYELIEVEKSIRACINLPNVYFLVIFACCREVYSETKNVIKTIPAIPEEAKE
jgi:hypothetical protein